MLEILIRNRWVKVPKDRILPESSPDGGVRACYSDPAPYMTEMTPGLIIRCVMVGGLTWARGSRARTHRGCQLGASVKSPPSANPIS